MDREEGRAGSEFTDAKVAGIFPSGDSIRKEGNNSEYEISQELKPQAGDSNEKGKPSNNSLETFLVGEEGVEAPEEWGKEGKDCQRAKTGGASGDKEGKDNNKENRAAKG